MGRRKKAADGNTEAEAGIGHNKPELTEDEQRVLLYQHKTSYSKAKKAVDDAKAELLRVCKLAKTECGKSAVQDIKTLILLDEPAGAEAMKIDIDRQLRLARWANSAIGTQFSFSDFDPVPAEDKARELGKTAGLKGEPCKPPYDPSVPQHNAWIEGWHEGQAVLASNFRAKMPDGGSQMDLADRRDLEKADPPLADPPFAAPPDDNLDVRTVHGGAFNRVPDAPARPQ